MDTNARTFSRGKQTLILLIGQGIYFLADIFIVFIIPIVDSYELTGIYSYSYSVASLFFITTTFCIKDIQVVYQYKDYSSNQYIGAFLYTTAFSILIMLGSSFLLCDNLKEQLVFITTSLGQILIGSTFYMIARLQISNRLDAWGWSNAICGIGKLAILLTGIFLDNVYGAILAMPIIGAISFWIVVYFFHRSIVCDEQIELSCFTKISSFFSKGSFRILRMCVPLTMIQIVNTFESAYVKFFIKYFWGNEEHGIFAVVTTISLVIPNVANCIIAPLLNDFATLYNLGERHKLKKKYVTTIVALVILYLLAIITMIKPLWIMMINYYGEQVLGHESLFVLSFISALMIAITSYSSYILVIFKKNRNQLFIVIGGLVIGLIIVPVLVKNVGLLGAMLSLVVVNSMVAMLEFVYSIFLVSNLKE